MDKYCTNCGKELKKEADYCLNCGIRISKQTPKINTKKPNEIISIIGMIFGIVSFIMIFMIDLEIIELKTLVYAEEFIIKIMTSLVITMFSIIPATIGCILSFYGILKEKNTAALIGIITSLISFTFNILTIIYII